MFALLAEISPAWVAVGLVLVFLGLWGTVALGRGVKRAAQVPGGSAAHSGSYYLKIT